MAAKKRKSAAPLARPLAGPALAGVRQAESLMLRGRSSEAADLLESLDTRYPGRPEILGLLVNAYYDVQDAWGYQGACERLIRARPDDPDVTSALAASYAVNGRPALALRTYRRFLERWPEDPRASEVRDHVASLEPLLDALIADVGLDGEDGLELAALHEEVQSATEHGRHVEARRAAEQLLRRRPEFVPALNNLSLAYALEGLLPQAIASAQRVLALRPENPHALSNMIRFLVLSGRAGEAGEWAERLKTVRSEAPDLWVKKAEAFSFLGDDEEVLAAFEEARLAGPAEADTSEGLLHHLAAVAAMRLGDERRARDLWRQALELLPGLNLAQDNLDDLRRPPGKRHAPWPFSLIYWVPARTLRELAVAAQEVADRGDDEEGVGRAVRRFLRSHPAVAGIIPALLDRGDPMGREFALRCALVARTPEMLEALRDFARGQRGPDEARVFAAQAAAQEGLIPGGLMRLWIEGEWREMMVFGFVLHGEPEGRHAGRAQRLAEQAHRALHEGRADDAEQALKNALAIEPDAPALLNNLAMAYRLQGREAECEQLLRRIFAAHPEYFFGRIGMAQLAIREGDLEEAQQLLDPLLQRTRLHYSEFAALCQAQMELLLAREDPGAALQWLGMWERADPRNPQQARWRARLRTA